MRETVKKLAKGLLDCAPMSLRATKQMITEGLSQPSLDAAFGAAYPAYETMLASEDAKEGSKAFLERRKPDWKNR
jgi:crotonobetainyl-CoA hydratase